MKTITYSVPAIHCNHCIHTIQMEVGEMEGVETVFADLNGKNVLIRYDDPATESEIQALLAEINYPVKL